MTAPRVLSIGQCFADHSNLVRTLHKAFGAEIVPAETLEDALTLARQGPVALVLVNRILDADGSSGLENILALKEDSSLTTTPIMLVSNLTEAQAQAEQIGAVAGFGKASLGHPAMLERVRPYLAGT